jgi:hypothetical protein
MKMFDLSFLIIFACWFAVSFPVSFSSSPINSLNGQHLRVIWGQNTNDLCIKLIKTKFKSFKSNFNFLYDRHDGAVTPKESRDHLKEVSSWNTYQPD